MIRCYVCSIGILSTVITRGRAIVGPGVLYSSILMYHPKSVAAVVTSPLSSQKPSFCSATSLTSNASNVHETDNQRIVPHSIGLGTYMIPRDQVNTTLRYAIMNAGYRRIDCAPVYFNEDVIGDTLYELFLGNPSSEAMHNNNESTSCVMTSSTMQQQQRIERSDIYLVSKLPSPFHRNVEVAVRKTLNDLRTDYLDLYLVHWPVAFFPVPIDPTKRGWENEDIDDSNNGLNIDESVSIHDVWREMEHIYRLGLVRHIGVSNMSLMLLHELLTRATIPPSVLQIELHPYLQQSKLVKYCQRRTIHVQAYSPLGSPGYKERHEPNVLHDPTLQRIAKSYSISTAQLCILWALQRGTSIVTKSLNEQHLLDNIQLLPIVLYQTQQAQHLNNTPTITLTDQDMNDISALDRGYRFFRPHDWWGETSMAVFD